MTTSSSPNLIAALIEDLDDLDISVRETALAKLRALGPVVVVPLLNALGDASMRRCFEAARILSDFDDPRWIEPMQMALASANPLPGQVAAGSLGSSSTLSVFALLNALPGCRGLVQLVIVTALGRIKDQRAVMPLISLLATVSSQELRYAIIETLGILGDSHAIGAIRSYQNDENHHVRKRVQTTLLRLETGPGVDASATGDRQKG